MRCTRTCSAESRDLADICVLPTLAMVLVDIAQFVLITRSSLLATLSEDYMTTARAKGLQPAAGAVATRCAQRAAARGHRHHAVRQCHWSAEPSRSRRCSPGPAWAS